MGRMENLHGTLLGGRRSGGGGAAARSGSHQVGGVGASSSASRGTNMAHVNSVLGRASSGKWVRREGGGQGSLVR